jgi:hypothetical protein
MFTPLVAKPPIALYSAAGTERTRNTSEVITGPSSISTSAGSPAITTKRVVLCFWSWTSGSSVCSP